MLTRYGKELRKIRLERNLTMTEMANALGITSTFLSMIENGQRNIPEDETSKVCTLYHLSNDEQLVLQKSEYASRKVLKMNLAGMETERKELLLRLSDNITSLTSSQINQMNHIMGVN